MGNSQIPALSGTSSMRKDGPASIVDLEVDNDVTFVGKGVDTDGKNMGDCEVTTNEFLYRCC